MIAIKLWGANQAGIPAAWPMECREGVEALPQGFDALVADNAEYEAYRTVHRPAYAAWLAAQPPAPEPVPAFITPRQMRLWLIGAGIPPAAVAAYLTTEEQRVEWEFASDIRRDHPLVPLLAGLLNLSPGQTDDAFRAASIL